MLSNKNSNRILFRFNKVILIHKVPFKNILTSFLFFFFLIFSWINKHDALILVLPASVAQLDVHPSGDQEVARSTSAGSATFFPGDLIMKYFLCSFSPFR